MSADAVGGVLTYALELAHGLDAEGVGVVLAVLGPPPSREQRERIHAAPLARFLERPYALEWMPDACDEVEEAGAWLLELAADVDLVHLNGYAHGALDFGVPKVVVGHSCVLSWHEAVRGQAAGAEWQAYRTAVTAGLRGADAVVAPTRAFARELDRLYDARARVIPNGMAPEALQSQPKEHFVLGVGRAWDEAKNLAALERIAPRLDVRLARGDAAHEEVMALCCRAAVFAEPAWYEPFGLAALEAGLCSCALVLGDIPSLREVWDDAALYVDPSDDDALLDACTEALAKHGTLGRAARRRALSYSRERMAAAYRDLYAGLLVREEAVA